MSAGPIPQVSPFLGMPPLVRGAIVFYYLVYHAAFPALAAILSPQENGPLVLIRMVLQLVIGLLVLLPLIFYRRDYGWLHPLILPTIFVIMKDVVKFPLHLLLPLSVPLESFAGGTTSMAYSLSMGADALERTRVGYDLIFILALCCYYAGYFYLPRLTVPKLSFAAPRNLQFVCLAATLICIVVASLFIWSAGGLTSYLVAMRGGRTTLFEGAGQFITLGEFSFVIVLLWFLYERRPFFNPAWVLTFVGAAATTLLIAGSRSALIYSLVTLLFLWWKKKGRIMIVPSVIFAVGALVVFGVFGAIRQDYGNDRIDYSVFSPARLTSILEGASTEFARRGEEEADLAAFAGAIDGQLLWGRTYLGAAAFWIPRAIWRDKPRSADSYNMWINFQGRSLDQPFSSGSLWGIPVSAVVEAFWNFHVVGVVVLFLLYGQFHRFLSNLVLAYPGNMAVFLPVMLLLTQFTATSLTFVTGIRDLILLAVLYSVLGILRFRRHGSKSLLAKPVA